jgi:hypothetical protein
VINIKKILHKSLVVAICQVLVYAPLSIAGQLSFSSGNLLAAGISPEVYIDQVGQSADYQITVTATVNVGVKPSPLYNGTVGTEEYKHKTQHQSIQAQDHG